MNAEQMQKRCPGSEFVGIVRLAGYRFVYDGYEEFRKGAVGNIVPDSDERADQSAHGVVWGALYKVTPENIAFLDDVETVKMDYVRQSVIVEGKEGKNSVKYENVGVYLRPPKELAAPTKEYRDTVVKGAQQRGLPEAYIANDLCKAGGGTPIYEGKHFVRCD